MVYQLPAQTYFYQKDIIDWNTIDIPINAIDIHRLAVVLPKFYH